MSAATFGDQLRGWRKSRAKSQLDLSTQVGYSQRHLSFLESGRARPSRVSVLALCDALEVPLKERNRLLVAAGFAPAYSHRPLDGPELRGIVDNVKAMIDRQAPFPTLLVDSVWNLVHANTTALQLFQDLLGDLSRVPPNVLDACFDEDCLRPLIKDWENFAQSFLERLRRVAVHDPADEELAALLARLEAKAPKPDPGPVPTALDPVMTLTLLRGDQELRLFSMIATIGYAQDVALEGLHVETFIPADEATRAVLESY